MLIVKRINRMLKQLGAAKWEQVRASSTENNADKGIEDAKKVSRLCLQSLRTMLMKETAIELVINVKA